MSERNALWDTLRAQKIFQSFSRSNYQGLQCTSTCQLRKIFSHEQINSFFFWNLTKGSIFLMRHRNFNSRWHWRCLLSWMPLLRTIVCLCPYIEEKDEECYESIQCKKYCHVSNKHFKDQKPTKYVVSMWWYLMLCQKDKWWLRKWKTFSIFEIKSPPLTISHNGTWIKMTHFIPFMA